EYSQRVRKRAFIFTTILMPLLMVGLMVVTAYLARMDVATQAKHIVVVDSSNIVGPALVDENFVSFICDTVPYPEVAALHGDSFGFLVVGPDIVDNPSALKLYTRQSSTMPLENTIRGQVSRLIEQERIRRVGLPSLDSIINSVKAWAQISTYTIGEQTASSSAASSLEQSSSSGASMVLAYVAGFMIYMFIFIYGAMVMQGVIEEKSSRIIEVIVSSVKPVQLMMGKIIGIALVAMTQVFIWVILVGVGAFMIQNFAFSSVASHGDMAASMAAAGVDPNLSSMVGVLFRPGYLIGIAACFLIFFIGGYLLYAAMFAAVGSGVDNVADTQQLQLPVTIPLILALVVMLNVMRDPGSSMAFWFSIIPFTSPIIMMARIPYGVPLWEIALSVVLLYGTFVAVTFFAAKIYRTGIFMYGKKPSLSEIIRWARHKN
ncbi:MAG: ABC transporter permease, partial [Mucinivorans sp.]